MMAPELVFMVEEASMEEILRGVLPRVLPPELAFRIIPHSGKGDLEKSIPRKLKAWANPHARFIILRDNDGGDCLALKSRLRQVCATGSGFEPLIRIVCQELESWFLGDLAAVQASGLPVRGDIAARQGKNPYRAPDRVTDAKGELRKLLPYYQPRSGARAIAPHLSLDKNRSRSFNVFLTGVKALVSQIESA